jgi:exopolyphosphatase/guanosine-5'-triphosphate,3'-diphosphate pyrophosphatase
MRAMQASRRAVIDIGTNSVKVLVADIEGEKVIPVIEDSKQTRLGKNFYQTRRLQADAIALTAEAVRKFVGIAKEHGATSIRVIGTSAARDATNSEELAQAVENASQLPLEIITGHQEAEWVFQGVTANSDFASNRILILDVGGGSTEMILGVSGKIMFQESFEMGAVRLLEECPHAEPPTANDLELCRTKVRDFLKTRVEASLGPALADAVKDSKQPACLVGTGGTTSILGRMELRLDTFDRTAIEAAALSLERMRWHVAHLWQLPLEKRKQIPGLPPNRADIILTGTVIYEQVMEQFGFDQLRISTRGLRFAAVK